MTTKRETVETAKQRTERGEGKGREEGEREGGEPCMKFISENWNRDLHELLK